MLMLLIASAYALDIGEHGPLSWYQSGAGASVCDTIANGTTYTFRRGDCLMQAKVSGCHDSPPGIYPCECSDVEITAAGPGCDDEELDGTWRKESITVLRPDIESDSEIECV